MADWPNQLQETCNRGVLSPMSLTPFGDYCDIAGVGYSVTATVWAANRAVYQPVCVRCPITITDAIVTVATQAGNLCVALYAWGNYKRIVTSGGVAVAAAGVQVVALADTLVEPGWYLLGFSCDSGTAAFRGTAVAVGIARVCGFAEQASAYVLPDPAVPATYATAVAPAIALSYTATI